MANWQSVMVLFFGGAAAFFAILIKTILSQNGYGTHWYSYFGDNQKFRQLIEEANPDLQRKYTLILYAQNLAGILAIVSFFLLIASRR